MKNFMKRIFIFQIMVLSFSIFSIEVTRPRYLVDGEPIPYVINVDGTPGLNTNSVSLADARIDALPVPILNNGEHLFLLGGGFVSEKYRGYDSYFLGTYASFFATGNLGEKFYYQTCQSVGLFGYKTLLRDKPALPWKYFQFSFVGYKWTPRIATDLGVMFISNFGNPAWIPLIQATFSFEPLIIDLALPLSISVRYLASHRFHLLIKGSHESSSYLLQNSLVQFNKPSAIFQTEFNLIQWIWFKAGVEYEAAGELKFQNIKMTRPETWKFYTGLEARI